jgi:cell division protein FtsN
VKLGITQLICLWGGVFLLALGGGFIGGKLAVQRHLTAVPGVGQVEPTQSATGNPADLTGLQKPPSPEQDENVPVHPEEEKAVSSAESDPGARTPEIREPSETFLPHYAIQVLSTRNLDEAQTARTKAEAQGFSVRILRVELEDKGEWYRVCVGPYRTKDAAHSALSDVRNVPGFQESFVKFLEPGTEFVEAP